MVHFPKESQIPTVKVDEFVLRCYLMSSLMGLNKCSSEPDLLRKNFVRLVDKAIHEYRKARKYIIKEIKEQAKSPSKTNKRVYTHIITNHLENCIGSINRACKVFDTLKGTDAFAVDRQKMIEFKRYTDCTCKTRDTFKDMEGEWKREESNQKHPAILHLIDNYQSVEIKKYKVSLKDLMTVLEHSHELGIFVASEECLLEKKS